jgi:hypothetical protein
MVRNCTSLASSSGDGSVRSVCLPDLARGTAMGSAETLRGTKVGHYT